MHVHAGTLVGDGPAVSVRSPCDLRAISATHQPIHHTRRSLLCAEERSSPAPGRPPGHILSDSMLLFCCFFTPLFFCFSHCKMRVARPVRVSHPVFRGESSLLRAFTMLSESLAALDLEASAPPSFCCPIGRELMHDPVSCSDGHSYEREHIVRWLRESRLSPVTGAPLPSPDLRPNHALRNAIEEWSAQQQPLPPPDPAEPAVPPPSPVEAPARQCHSSPPLARWGAGSWLRHALGT